MLLICAIFENPISSKAFGFHFTAHRFCECDALQFHKFYEGIINRLLNDMFFFLHLMRETRVLLFHQLLALFFVNDPQMKKKQHKMN